MATGAGNVQLTIPQAEQYAVDAGFKGSDLVTVLSIGMAESGLNTQAYNGSDPYGGSYGVLQINGAHFGETFGPNGEYVVGQGTMYDPAMNFLFGYELFLAQGFNPWSTYTSGAYLNFVPQVQGAIVAGGVTKGPLSKAPGPLGPMLNPSSAIGDVLKAIDAQMVVINPFDTQTYNDVTFGAGDVVGWGGAVLGNIYTDMTAVILRLILIVIGFVIVARIVFRALPTEQVAGVATEAAQVAPLFV